MTELNSILHEYEADININSDGHPIVTEADAELVGNAALKVCYPKVGIMLDYRSCAQKFNIDRLLCQKGETKNCLTSAQLTVMKKVYEGPAHLNGPAALPGRLLTRQRVWAWLAHLHDDDPDQGRHDVRLGRYFAFETDIGTPGVDDEQFTAAYFKQIERLAPFWDATDPDLSTFEQSGGKLILWQGEADWSIPTVSSIAYYQAAVKAMGGIANTQSFARYYLLPGVGHCGSGAPDTYAGLASVVSWTETGMAPNALTADGYPTSLRNGGPTPSTGSGSTSDLTDTIPDLGAPASGSVIRSDRLFPYPELPAYNGYGKVDDASSYIGEVSQALEQPVEWLGKFSTIQIWCNPIGTDCRPVNAAQPPHR